MRAQRAVAQAPIGTVLREGYSVIDQEVNERWVGACKRPPSQSRRLQPSMQSDQRGKARKGLGHAIPPS